MIFTRRIGEIRPIPGVEGTGRDTAAGRNKARTNHSPLSASRMRDRLLLSSSISYLILMVLSLRLGQGQIWTANMHAGRPPPPGNRGKNSGPGESRTASACRGTGPASRAPNIAPPLTKTYIHTFVYIYIYMSIYRFCFSTTTTNINRHRQQCVSLSNSSVFSP